MAHTRIFPSGPGGFNKHDDYFESDKYVISSGVAGVDEVVDVLALEEAQEDFEAVLGFFDWPQIKAFGNDGEVGERPFAAFDFDALGQAELEQVADGGRNDVLVAFEIVIVFVEAAKGLGNIRGHGRLFGYD